MDLTIADLSTRCHAASYAIGWWHHPNSGLPYIPGDSRRFDDDRICNWGGIHHNVREMIVHYWPFVIATKLALVQSEVSEGLEAFRRGAMDDKLHHRLGIETEIADSLIRQFDLAGAIERARKLGVVQVQAPFDLTGAIHDKMAFNAVREDHKVEVRSAAGGKAF